MCAAVETQGVAGQCIYHGIVAMQSTNCLMSVHKDTCWHDWLNSSRQDGVWIGLNRTTRKRSGCKIQNNEIERQKQTMQLLPQTKNTGGKKENRQQWKDMIYRRTEEKKNTSGLWDLCRSFHLGIWSWRTSGCRGERQERATVAVKSWKTRIWAYNNCLLSSWLQPLRLPLSVSQLSRQTVWSY